MTTNNMGLVQKQLVSSFRYTIAATVLTVTRQQGPGSLTRLGAGILSIVYPAGKGIDTLRQCVEAYVTGTVAASAHYNSATATDTSIAVNVFDAAGMALDNQPGVINVYQILGD